MGLEDGVTLELARADKPHKGAQCAARDGSDEATAAGALATHLGLVADPSSSFGAAAGSSAAAAPLDGGSPRLALVVAVERNYSLGIVEISGV